MGGSVGSIMGCGKVSSDFGACGERDLHLWLLGVPACWCMFHGPVPSQLAHPHSAQCCACGTVETQFTELACCRLSDKPLGYLLIPVGDDLHGYAACGCVPGGRSDGDAAAVQGAVRGCERRSSRWCRGATPLRKKYTVTQRLRRFGCTRYALLGRL